MGVSTATKTRPAPPQKRPVKSKSITILHLYPRELNIYGDRGNILTLVKRLKWRGFAARVVESGIGDKADIAGADIIFGGGGQDRGQLAVGQDIQRHGEAIRKAAEGGTPILTVCGSYQLFGRGFTTLEGDQIPGIGLFKARTVGSTKRMIGNVIVDSPLGRLVGFENHSGRTVLEEGQEPLGQVVQGYGNDGRSGQEGCVHNNTYGTYLHGPVLPKNPALADALILEALKRKFGVTKLEPLNDNLEQLAAKDSAARPQ